MPSNHLILSHPLVLPSSIIPSNKSLFKWVSSSHLVTKVLESQLQHQSFKWIFRTDFFRIDCLDLLAIQGILKSLLQHHSPKASNLWRSAFFMIQLSYPYMTTGKTIALTRWTFVGYLMFLLFNKLSGLVIAFSPGSKHLLEPKKRNSVSVSPSICHEVMRQDAMILVFWMLSFKPTFSLSSFTFIKRLFSSSFSAIRVVHLHIGGYWHFSWQSWLQLVLHPAWHFWWCTLHIS